MFSRNGDENFLSSLFFLFIWGGFFCHIFRRRLFSFSSCLCIYFTYDVFYDKYHLKFITKEGIYFLFFLHILFLWICPTTCDSCQGTARIFVVSCFRDGNILFLIFLIFGIIFDTINRTEPFGLWYISEQIIEFLKIIGNFQKIISRKPVFFFKFWVPFCGEFQ